MEKDNLELEEPIYKEGRIEVRSFSRDSDAHRVIVGEHCFILQHGCLEQFAMRTAPEDLRAAFSNYNPSLPYVLDQERISPEVLALILARANNKQQEEQARQYRQIKLSSE